jgi:hypothetical protein
MFPAIIILLRERLLTNGFIEFACVGSARTYVCSGLGGEDCGVGEEEELRGGEGSVWLGGFWGGI